MKRKICWIIAIITMAFATSCRHNEKLDSIKDQELIRAMNSAKNQSDKDIDIEALENCIAIYEKKGEKGKICLCEAYIGYKLFFEEDYDKSLIHLKRAEKNIQYCDSMASFIYTYIAYNTKATDSILAINYAQKATEKDLEYNNLRRLPYSYLDLSLLTKGDSARYFLQKSLNLFDDNKKIMAKAQFGRFHSSELDADTVIKYVKPYYETINYVGYARTLIDAYIRKDMPDSTKQYLQHLASRKDFENDYFYCNAEVLTSQGKYEEGCKWWKQAYNRNEAEWQFMINQRLGAINAEYDLLNAELENKKEKLRIRGAYNVMLLIVIVILIATYTIKERHRKNAEKLKLNVDELEQDVCELEENVSNLELNVSHLEGNVNNLEQEVSNLERDIKIRKKKFISLFEDYRKVYKAHRDTIFDEALSNLSEMHLAYPKLTKTDLTIIWLTFMNCSRDIICEAINISQTYYYQRKSIIHHVLGIPVRDGESWHKPLEKIVRKYIQIEN